MLMISYFRINYNFVFFFFFSSRRRHTRSLCDWSSDVCSSDLQRALGAAFNARVLMPLNAVTMTGALGRRNSSPALVRGFCTICGTSLFTERASAGVVGLTCGSLDTPEDCQPSEHIWTSSKQAWLTLNDGLPQYPEGAPA